MIDVQTLEVMLKLEGYSRRLTAGAASIVIDCDFFNYHRGEISIYICETDKTYLFACEWHEAQLLSRNNRYSPSGYAAQTWEKYEIKL